MTRVVCVWCRRSEDVRVVSSRQQGRHLVVLLSVATDGHLPAAVMAASDYEELETLFHTDLQSLDLQVRMKIS